MIRRPELFISSISLHLSMTNSSCRFISPSLYLSSSLSSSLALRLNSTSLYSTVTDLYSGPNSRHHKPQSHSRASQPHRCAQANSSTPVKKPFHAHQHTRGTHTHTHTHTLSHTHTLTHTIILLAHRHQPISRSLLSFMGLFYSLVGLFC